MGLVIKGLKVVRINKCEVKSHLRDVIVWHAVPYRDSIMGCVIVRFVICKSVEFVFV